MAAHSVGEAKRIFQASKVHILLSDIEMMGNDGFDLLSWVQEYYPKNASGISYLPRKI